MTPKERIEKRRADLPQILTCQKCGEQAFTVVVMETSHLTGVSCAWCGATEYCLAVSNHVDGPEHKLSREWKVKG